MCVGHLGRGGIRTHSCLEKSQSCPSIKVVPLIDSSNIVEVRSQVVCRSHPNLQPPPPRQQVQDHLCLHALVFTLAMPPLSSAWRGLFRHGRRPTGTIATSKMIVFGSRGIVFGAPTAPTNKKEQKLYMYSFAPSVCNRGHSRYLTVSLSFQSDMRGAAASR